MPDILVIYHGNCADGFTAAWIIHTVFGDSIDGHEVEYFPATYGEEMPEPDGRHVLMVDFSYKRDMTEVLAAESASLLILDHHKTAEAELRGLDAAPVCGDWMARFDTLKPEGGCVPMAMFDMDRSGAAMAWDYFYPGRPRPSLVDYVDDRDRWQFRLPHSKEIAAWVFSYGYDIVAWSQMANKLASPGGFNHAWKEGAAILRKQEKDIRELTLANRTTWKIDGYPVPVCNLPYTLASDAAHYMADDDTVIFAACYSDGPRVRRMSLRSVGEFDVSEVARKFGGGGHRNAAGFEVPLDWRGDKK